MVLFDILIVLIYIPVLLYSWIIIIAIFGISNTKFKKIDKKYLIIGAPTPHFSIILPVRNERGNIEHMINQILGQSFIDFELIIIDDHSEDETFELAGKYIDQRVKLFRLASEKEGKKDAIITGINIALGKYIIFIDADVTIDEDWLESYYIKTMDDYDFIIGMVSIEELVDNLLERFQRIEYVAMQLVNIGFLYFKKPFLCSGSNFCVKHTVLAELINDINNKTPSGDDVFLLHSYLKKGNKICVNDFYKSIVYTYPALSVRRFLLQRIRWASKTKYYKNKTALLVSIVVFLTSFTLVFSFFYLFIDRVFLGVFLYIFCLKLIVDFILIKKGTKNIFKNFKFPFHEFLLFSFIYPFYVFVVAVLSLFLPVKWKGRTWRKKEKMNIIRL
ncbi:MAG: glycosyltransferase [Bacteroidales bacterium]|nr:glycosyltransferase [Bacteroidales bacterium]